MADPTTSKPASVQMYALTVGGVRVPLRADASGNLVLAATIDTTNLALHTDVDGLEALVTSSNTKLDTLHTDVAANTTAQATSAKQDTAQTTLASLDGKVTAAAAAGDSVANPTAGGVLGFLLGWTGSVWQRIKSTSGALWVQEQFAPAYEDNAAGVARVEQRYSYDYTAGTTAGKTIKSGAGYIDGLVIGTPGANGVLTVYDNTAASGTVLYKTTFPAALLGDGPRVVPLHVVFATGLTIVVATAGLDVTVGWR